MHERVGQAAFLSDAEAAIGQQVLDFRHRAAGFKTEIADDDVGFVEQDARADEQLRLREARVDRAVKFGAAVDDERGVGLGQIEQRADAVGGRGQLGDRGVEFLDRLARLFVEDFQLLDAAAQIAEFDRGAANRADRIG